MSIVQRASILLGLAVLGPGVTHAQTTTSILALTDGSGPFANGSQHVDDLIAAFAAQPGVLVTTDPTSLTSAAGVSLATVSGKDIVLVVTVSGAPISPASVAVLQTAIVTRASEKFMFFTDGCSQCTRDSLTSALSIVNAVGGWSSYAGPATDEAYTATLSNGPLAAVFSALPTITSVAYSPVLGLYPANVLYTSDAPSSPGPMAGFVSSFGTSCVFFCSDTTEFWTSGGIPVAQANGLASAYLSAADEPCPVLGTASPRDCSGPPNVDHLIADRAIIGQPWIAEVIHQAAQPAAASTLLVRSSAIPGYPTQYGCLLVAGTRYGNLLSTTDSFPPILPFQISWSLAIPNDVALLWLPWHVQALTFGGTTRLSNAIDGVVGTY